MSPFYALYAFNPKFTWDVEDDTPEGKAPTAHERAVVILAEREHMADRLREAVKF